MHAIFLSVWLGIIEGVTEFLPVSSTAHLRLAEGWIFHLPLDDPFWKMYSIVIQLGAVLCLPTYFYREIIRLCRSFPRKLGPEFWKHPITLLMIAFVCTAGPAFLLKKIISANLENLQVIGSALLIGGAVMWAVDVVCTRPKVLAMDQMNIFQAVWIGLVQTLSAVFPGTSRSMSTIAAGQTAGLSRAAALEFSFFLSMPTMAVATLYDLTNTLRHSHDPANLAPLDMNGQRWLVLLVGTVVSYIVALGVVAWFMGWVRKRGFVPFAIYRIILGLIVLISIRIHPSI